MNERQVAWLRGLLEGYFAARRYSGQWDLYLSHRMEGGAEGMMLPTHAGRRIN